MMNADWKPSGGPDPDSMSVLMLAGYLPDTELYSTLINTFPGERAQAPWGLRGHFRISVEVFEDGESVGSLQSRMVDETGNIQVDLGEITARLGRPVRGLYIIRYEHAKDIPVSIYAFHVHKATGTYVSCNTTPFVGAKQVLTAHTEEMENALFWPGVVADDTCDSHIVLINPFSVVHGYQVHLIGPGGAKAVSPPIRLKPMTVGEFPLAGLFPDHVGDMQAGNGGHSICVASQYKLVTYFMVKNRRSGVMCMMDHLHTFCLT